MAKSPKTKQKNSKLGRPKYKFTPAQIKKAGQLALIGCQNGTIASIIGCDDGTIKKYLSPILTKKRAERKVWLRELQATRAEMDKTSAMAIFLGKNELGQADKMETRHDVTPELQTVLGLINGSTKAKLPADDSRDSSKAS